MDFIDKFIKEALAKIQAQEDCMPGAKMIYYLYEKPTKDIISSYKEHLDNEDTSDDVKEGFMDYYISTLKRQPDYDPDGSMALLYSKLVYNKDLNEDTIKDIIICEDSVKFIKFLTPEDAKEWMYRLYD